MPITLHTRSPVSHYRFTTAKKSCGVDLLSAWLANRRLKKQYAFLSQNNRSSAVANVSHYQFSISLVPTY